MNGSNFCGNSDITKIFIVEPNDNNFTGGTINGDLVVNGNIINCSSGATIYTETILPCFTAVTINNAISIYPDAVNPTSDDLISLGSSTRRYRDVNTVSGNSSYWTSTVIIHTPILDLGFDSSGNTRQITADNSIIQDDIIFGGIY
jgi:hypothetical protein